VATVNRVQTPPIRQATSTLVVVTVVALAMLVASAIIGGFIWAALHGLGGPTIVTVSERSDTAGAVSLHRWVERRNTDGALRSCMVKMSYPGRPLPPDCSLWDVEFDKKAEELFNSLGQPTQKEQGEEKKE
jgi:hypothetical protein